MNRFIVFAFCAVAGIGHAQIPTYVPADGLLAWYPFDGNAQDASENALHAVASGVEAAVDRNGQENGALAFGSGIDAPVSVVQAPGLVDDVVNTFSYAFWAKPGLIGANYIIHPIHGHFFGTDSLHAGAGVSFSQTKIIVQEHSDMFLAVPLMYNLPDTATDWHHVSVVYSNGTPRLYFDGTAVAEGTATDRDTHISLGIDPWYPNGGMGYGFNHAQYDGAIDDIGFWDRALTAAEITALYTGVLSVQGCTDATACNFDEAANTDDGTCVFPPFGLADCEAGGSLCGDGTVWDAMTQSCVGFEACPSDLDDDGVIGVGDLMTLLSDFGTDCPAAWACGAPVQYQGYDYATVQIGEQCWFAENLRATTFTNGDSIATGLSDSQWGNATDPARTVYGETGTVLYGSDNVEDNLSAYGRLYNGFVVQDDRGICPYGWNVPTESSWTTLEFTLGMDSVEVAGTHYRGSAGEFIKSSPTDTPSWNGSNTTGWSGLPGGARAQHSGPYFEEGLVGYFWGRVAEWNGASIPYRALGGGNGIYRADRHPTAGFSIRCVMD